MKTAGPELSQLTRYIMQHGLAPFKSPWMADKGHYNMSTRATRPDA